MAPFSAYERSGCPCDHDGDLADVVGGPSEALRVTSEDAALAASRLAVMRDVESGPYRPPGDYLARAAAAAATEAPSQPSSTRSLRRRPRGRLPVDAACRARMVEWARSVCDYCDFSHDSLATTFSLLDRYLSTPSGVSALHDQDKFQLVTLTALYVAVKVCEVEIMGPDIIVKLSRGVIRSAEEVKRTEIEMLNAVGWRAACPPTPGAFVSNFFALMPEGMRRRGGGDEMYRMAKGVCESSVGDYDLTTGSLPSEIACAALLNALDERVSADGKVHAALANMAQTVMGVEDVNSADFVEVRRRLLRIAGGDCDACVMAVGGKASSSSESSLTLATEASSNCGGDYEEEVGRGDDGASPSKGGPKSRRQVLRTLSMLLGSSRRLHHVPALRETPRMRA